MGQVHNPSLPFPFSTPPPSFIQPVHPPNIIAVRRQELCDYSGRTIPFVHRTEF
ncbi:MAG: hypothetical protein UZ03_NOB001003373 [Nitrospira sp. OLB3]|nr:MAG: hypothetical protein UZ03_NOB001003373 [Nitrospira sp. OLB3]